MAPITIRGNVLDPASPGDVQLPADASKTNFVLVQLKHEMTQDIVVALHEKHASIIKRMQGNTWLVVYPPADLRALEAIDGVDHALVYLNDFVVHNDLKGRSDDQVLGQTVGVALHEHAEASRTEILQEISDLSSVQLQTQSSDLVYLKASAEDLNRIAAIDGVQAIEVAPVWIEQNDLIKTIVGVDAVNKSLAASNKSLTGEGQIVALVDSGIDDQHEAFRSNKIVAKWSVRTNANTTEDLSGHGTHTAGTVAGLGIPDWQGKEITGVAPNAKLVMVAFTGDPKNEAEGGPGDWYEGIKKKVGTCRIVNNSYGPPVETEQPPYTRNDAELIDAWALQNPEFLIVFSAGNWGRKPPPAQVGGVAVAKNALTVGATYSDRPTREDVGNWAALVSGDPSSTVVDYSEANLKVFKSTRGMMAEFSSRGPVLNTGRTKPDIVAPGVCVLSARAKKTPQIGFMQDVWAKAAGSYPGGPKDTDKLIYTSGTSMSAPAVCGCAALLREALLKWRNFANPSAPLMKALLINGADKLPNILPAAQGFGQINLVRTLKHLGGAPGAVPTGSGFDQKTVKTTSAIDPYKTKVPVAGPSAKQVNFIATLVYHDIAAAETTNQMELVVTYKGQSKIASPLNSNDNVIQFLLEGVEAGQDISIQPRVKLLARGEIPWGLAWDNYEVSK